MSKVKIAIVGCGGYSGAHARRLKVNPDASIVALCDVDETIVQGYIQRNLDDYAEKPAIFTDRAAMYDKVRPDAVVIVTPHTLHHEHIIEALDHGCHVLVEKPMVTSAKQAYEVAEKAQQAGRLVCVGYNTPCTPEFHYIRQVIRQNELGRLQLVSGYLIQDWMRLSAGTWRQNPKLSGGGQAYDSGAHVLNSLCWTVESQVAQVLAFIDHCGSPVDINSSINVRFTNGVFAAIVIGGNTTSHGSQLSYVFENGRIDIDGWAGQWIRIWRGKEPVKYPPIVDQPLTPDDNFVDAILGRAEPRTSPINGVIQSELMDAIYESARTGKAVSPCQRQLA